MHIGDTLGTPLGLLGDSLGTPWRLLGGSLGTPWRFDQEQVLLDLFAAPSLGNSADFQLYLEQLEGTSKGCHNGIGELSAYIVDTCSLWLLGHFPWKSSFTVSLTSH